MTRRLPSDAGGIAEAARLLAAGGLVALPTETVYGLGADATDELAVARIFEAKGRPRFNPLICHFADPAMAFAEVRPSKLATKLGAAFWPGPLTLVLPRRSGSRIALLTGAGLDTLAVRVPAHPVALALLRRLSFPVAAPSANPSGSVSPTSADHVLQGLAGRIDAVLDGGSCDVGLESTVLDLTVDPPRLLRPGGVTVDAIEAVVGAIGRPDADAPIRAPGQLLAHYAPACAIRLDAMSVAHDEALLAFGPPLPGSDHIFQLSATQNLVEAASRLFAGLRALDALAARHALAGIAAMPVPSRGMGEAINDRLRRAAA